MKLHTLSIRCLLLATLCCQVWGVALADPEPAAPAKETKSETKPSPPATGKKPPPPASNKNKPAAAKGALKNIEFNAEREQAALEFAQRHHPELVVLISPLKDSNPKEYQRAVKDLFRASERLSTVQTKDPARYDLELEAWKLQSQIRLLAARLSMVEDPELEQQLRAALAKKAAVQVKLLENERATLESRLKQVQSQIEQNEKSREQFVQQEYDRLVKKSNRNRTTTGSSASTGKPAAKKSTSPKAADSQ